MKMRIAASLLCAGVLSACQTTAPVKRALPAPIPPKPVAPASPVTAVAEVPPPRTPLEYTFLQPEAVSPRSGGELFDRLVQRFADVPCVKDPLVERWQQIYARSPTRFAAQLEQVLPFAALALDETERYRLPGEFALIPIVESWYRPDAGVGRSYVGLWQFGASTAATMGLPVRNDYDGRMAPFAATDAALRHLGDMHNDFGDWKLANLGFNAGAYRVGKLVDKAPFAPISASNQSPPTLAAGTYEHLAKVQALACLLAQPERFGIELPRAAPIATLTTVTLPPGTSTLAAIAKSVDIDAAELMRINPAYRRGIVSAAASRELLVPRSQANRFAQFTMPIVAPPAAAPATAAANGSGTREHVVRGGDTLGAIARAYHLRMRDLLTWNYLTSKSMLKLGQRIKLEP